MKAVKSIKQSYKINASVEEVWQALTNPVYIDAWGGGPSRMSDEMGKRFSLWGADIFGKNIEVDRLQKLKQEWYGGKWDEPSIVTFLLEEKGNTTKLTLLHDIIPDYEEKKISDGWKKFYLGPLKKYLENK